MPFVTEELWQHLRGRGRGAGGEGEAKPAPESIMVAAWPKTNKKLIDEEAEEQFERFKAVVAAIRNTKAELNVPADTKPPVRLSTGKAPLRHFFETHRSLLQILAGAGEVHVEAARQRIKHAAATVVDGIEVLIPLEGIIDPAKERGRLGQRVNELTNHIKRLEAQLANKQFTEKAPKEVVEQMKASLIQARETLKKSSEHLAILQSM